MLESRFSIWRVLGRKALQNTYCHRTAIERNRRFRYGLTRKTLPSNNNIRQLKISYSPAASDICVIRFQYNKTFLTPHKRSTMQTAKFWCKIPHAFRTLPVKFSPHRPFWSENPNPLISHLNRQLYTHPSHIDSRIVSHSSKFSTRRRYKTKTKSKSFSSAKKLGHGRIVLPDIIKKNFLNEIDTR